MNLNFYCVLDTETSSANPHTTQPIQLAAIMLDPRTLREKPNGRFNSLIRPDDFSLVEDQALAVNRKTIAELQEAPDISSVWQEFVAFVKRFSRGTSEWNAPIAVGHNLHSFDWIILERLRERFGTKKLFHPRDRVDTLAQCHVLFESQREPERYSLDNLRQYFDYSTENSHDALADVEFTAFLLRKILGWTRDSYKKMPLRIA